MICWKYVVYTLLILLPFSHGLVWVEWWWIIIPNNSVIKVTIVHFEIFGHSLQKVFSVSVSPGNKVKSIQKPFVPFVLKKKKSPDLNPIKVFGHLGTPGMRRTTDCEPITHDWPRWWPCGLMGANSPQPVSESVMMITVWELEVEGNVWRLRCFWPCKLHDVMF